MLSQLPAWLQTGSELAGLLTLLSLCHMGGFKSPGRNAGLRSVASWQGGRSYMRGGAVGPEAGIRGEARLPAWDKTCARSTLPRASQRLTGAHCDVASCLVLCGDRKGGWPAGVPATCCGNEIRARLTPNAAPAARRNSKRSPFASPDSINSLNLPRSPQSRWEARVWDTIACI